MILTAPRSLLLIFVPHIQQVQLCYAGCSRYIGLFDTREEAAVAYEMARECCDSFKDDDYEGISPDQVKRNLNVMRKAAVLVCKLDEPKEETMLPQVKNRIQPVAVCYVTQPKINEKAKPAKKVDTDARGTKEDAEVNHKRKFNSDIYEKAQELAAALPRGITVRPSGKWVSSAL